jgi:hypothetical protein
MIISRTTIAALAAAFALPALALAQDTAQKKPIELGIDAAIARESEDGRKVTSLVLPISRFRVGFFLTDAVSLEPSVSFSYYHISRDIDIPGFDGTSSGFNYDLDVGLLYHFRTDRTKAQPYVRPFLGLRGFSADNESPNSDFPDSGTQVSFGAGLGYKIPLANRVGTRLEVGYSHAGENEPVFSKSNRIFLSIGLSFLTR